MVRLTEHEQGSAFLPEGDEITISAFDFALALLREHGIEVITANDAETRSTMRRIWPELKQTVEPSSALVLAAVMKQRERFRGKRVGLVVTGGNVDLDSIDLRTAA